MRETIDRQDESNGATLLVSDPHDGSRRERWFVEAQIRFNTEGGARAFWYVLRAMSRVASWGTAARDAMIDASAKKEMP